MAEPTTTTLRSPPSDDLNAWADYWRYELGLNTIPAHTLVKKTSISWKEWQMKPIPEELHEQWKRENKFADGLAIIPGKVWHGEHAGKYLIFIDCDNLKSIEEFCTRNGKTVSLRDISEKFIVEQHKDNPNKAHIYVYSETPFIGKSSDTNKVGIEKIANNELPALEVKGLGTHGIAYCTPSVHKNGERYQIIGTTMPITLNIRQAHELMQHIDSFLTKYGLGYLKNADNGIGTGKALIPMEELGREDFVINEGHNRHEALLRYMESRIMKLRTSDVSLSEINQLCYNWNQKHCKPPLEDKEFERQWKDALNFIARKDREREEREIHVNEKIQEWQQQQRQDQTQEIILKPQEPVSQEALLRGCRVMELVTEEPEIYIAVRKDDNNWNDTLQCVYPIRAIQQITYEWNTKKRTKEAAFKHIILNAIPVEPVEVIYDPFFDQLKYRMKFEYIGANKQVIETKDPVGPYTIEELIDYLKTKTNWVYKRNLLDDAMNQVLKGYVRRGSGMIVYKEEIDIEGLIWDEKSKKLILSKIQRYKPTPEEAMQCIKVIEELQQKFYSPTTKRPLERKRYSHLVKIGIVSIIDFARRQNGAAQPTSYGIIPMQDFAGWSKSGKTYGYAGILLKMLRLSNSQNKKYIIGAGSVESEARLIDQTKWTTMPIIFDDSDFLTESEESSSGSKGGGSGGKEAKRCLSLIKYARDMTNPRDILTQDSKRKNLPFCAFPMFTRNTGLITEEGFIRRATSHEFTVDDEKSEEERQQYDAYFKEHAHTFGFLMDFAIDYYVEHPDLLFNDWLTIAQWILTEFYRHAESDHPPPDWLLSEVCPSATSQDALAEYRSSSIASTLHDIIQNQAWVRNKREAAIYICKYLRKDLNAGEYDYESSHSREVIDNALVTATLEEKVRALIAIDAIPFFRWHETYGVCMTAPVVEELKKHGISRVSHTQLPSYCEGFAYETVRFGTKTHKVVCAKLEDFITFINPPAIKAPSNPHQEQL